MALTLAAAKAQLAQQLSDLQNLTWSESALEEALRMALAALSRTYGTVLCLNGLDGASETTFEDIDAEVLLSGGLAYAVRHRVMGRFEEASPENMDPEKMAEWAEKTMNKFQADLTLVKMRCFQESAETPYSGWMWDEGVDF